MKNIGKIKKLLSLFLAVIMLLCSAPVAEFPGMTIKASAIDSRVERAVQTAVAIANDNSHGYSQINRQGPDYDCSSLVYYAFSSAGFSLSPAWFNTGNMGTALKNAGFTEITNIDLSTSANLQRGDILWKSGHTEIYVGSNQLIGAHSDENGGIYGNKKGDQTGREISVGNYYYEGRSESGRTPWTRVYRYSGYSSGTKPVITLDKTVYTVGNTMNITWTKYANSSEFKHYWLVITNTTNGKQYYGTVSGQDGDVNANSYSIKLTEQGNIKVTVYAVKKDGTGIYDSKVVTVCSASVGTKPTIVLSKDNYTVGDMMNITWTKFANSFDFKHYWLVITNTTNGKQYYGTVSGQDGDVSANSYSLKLTEQGSIKITVYAIKWDGTGISDSKTVSVHSASVGTKPIIKLNKESYIVGETMSITWTKYENPSDFKHYWLVITNTTNGNQYYGAASGQDGDVNANSYSLKLTEQGNIKITVYAINRDGVGIADSETAIVKKVHIHSYTSSITTAATCTANGVKTYTCSGCGNSYTETIAKTGHKYDSGKITKTPTCVKTGVKTYTCTVCGAKKKETIAKDPNNHSDAVGLDNWNSIEPSCTKNGYSGDWYCSDCDGLVQKGKVIKKTGHKDKNKDDYCDNCGKYLRKDPIEIKGAKVTAQTSKTITGTWKKTGGSGTVYRLFIRRSDKEYFEYDGSTKNNKYTFKKLKPGTSYEWFVVVWNSDGSDKAISAGVYTSTLPSAPSIKVTAGSKKAVVKWSAVSGAKNYTVYYSTSKNSGYKKAGTTSGKSYSVKKLKPGKTYYFKVVANKKVGSKTYTSAYSKIVSAKIKK